MGCLCWFMYSCDLPTIISGLGKVNKKIKNLSKPMILVQFLIIKKKSVWFENFEIGLDSSIFDFLIS